MKKKLIFGIIALVAAMSITACDGAPGRIIPIDEEGHEIEPVKPDPEPEEKKIVPEVKIIGEYTIYYNGKEHTPSVVLSHKNIELEHSDYDVTYSNNINAGTANILITSKGDKYEFDPINKTFEIQKYTVVISWDKDNYYYNGGVQEIHATYLDINSAKKSLAVTTDRPFKDAGDYIATASFLTEEANYKLPNEKSKVYHMNKTSITGVHSSGYNGIYDGAEHSISVDAPQGSKITYTTDPNGEYSEHNPTFKNAGTHITFFKVEKEGCLPFLGSDTVIINPKSINIDWAPNTFVYTGEVQAITATYKDIESNDISLNVTTNIEFKNPGRYVATASFKNGEVNYILPADPTREYIIPEKEISGVSHVGFIGDYDGEGHSISVTAPSGTTVTYSLDEDGSYSLTNPTFVDVGNYTVYFKVEMDGAKTICGYDEVIIKVKKVEVNWCDNNFSYTGEEQNITASYKNIKGEDIALVVSTIPSSFKERGDYLAFAEFKETTVNYLLLEPTSKAYQIKSNIISGVTSEGFEGEFDGSAHTITVSAPEGFDITYSIGNEEPYLTTCPQFTDAGIYKVNFKVTDKNGIYDPYEGSEIVLIYAKEVSIDWCEDNFSYNGLVQNVSASYKDIDNKDVDLFVSLDKEFKNVGTYLATASFKNGEINYVLPEGVTKTYQIKNSDMVVTCEDVETTYDGLSHSIEVNAPSGSDISYSLSEEGPYTSSLPSFTDAGEYRIFYKVEKEGYNTFTGSNKVKINPLEIDEIIWDDRSFTYTGEVLTPTAHYEDIKGNLIDLVIDFNGEEFKDAGSYEAKAKFAHDETNYVLPQNDGKTLTISPKVISIDWCDNNFIFNGEEQTITASYQDVDGNTIDLLVTTQPSPFKIVGEYTATASFAHGETNYALPNQMSCSKVYNMKSNTPSEDDYSVKSYIGTYDGEDHGVTIEKQLEGSTVYYSETGIDGSWTTTPYTYVDAGIHTLYIKFTKESYEDYLTSANVNISQREISVDVGSYESTYGESIETLIGTLVGGSLVEGDELNNLISLERESGTNAGKYDVIGTCLNDNYLITFIGETDAYEISKRTIGINWGKLEFEFDGNEHSTTAVATNLVGLDEVLLTVDGSFANAGSHLVTARFVNDETNYELPDLVEETLIISPKEVSISWCDNDFTYNGEVQTITATYQDVDGNDIDLTVTTDPAVFKEAGDYVAEVSFAYDETNYVLPQVTTKEYQMKAQPTLTVTSSSYSGTYDGESHGITVNVTETGAVITYSISEFGEYNEENITKVDAGSYTIYFKVNKEGYNEYKGKETITIAPKELTSPTVEYDVIYYTNGSTQVIPTITIKDGEVTLTKDKDYSLSGDLLALEPGDYSITAEFKGNYTGDSLTLPWTLKLKEHFDTEVVISDWLEGDDPSTPSVTNNPGEGTIVYEYAISGLTDYSSTVPTTAGNYVCRATISETDLYMSEVATKAFTIYSGGATLVTAPVLASELTYSASLQNLVSTPGEALNGTVQYALSSDGDFSVNIPQGLLPGNYDVYYKVKGNNGYRDLATKKLGTVEIKTRGEELIEAWKYAGFGWGVNSKFVKYGANDYRLVTEMDANDWSICTNIPNSSNNFISDSFSVNNGETVSVNFTIPCYDDSGNTSFLSKNGPCVYVNLLNGDTGAMISRVKIWVDSAGYNNGSHSAWISYGDNWPTGNSNELIYWIAGDARTSSSFTFSFNKENLWQADCAGHGMVTLDDANGTISNYINGIKNSLSHVKIQITADNGWTNKATLIINSINGQNIQAWAVNNEGDPQQGRIIDNVAPSIVTTGIEPTVALKGVEVTLPYITHDLCSDVNTFIFVNGRYYGTGNKVTLNSAGTHQVTYYAVDYHGNVSMKQLSMVVSEDP